MKRVARAATEQAAAPTPKAGWAGVTSQVQARAEPVEIPRVELVEIPRAELVEIPRAELVEKVARQDPCLVTSFFRPSIPIPADPWAGT